MELAECRKKIDEIDAVLLQLFCQRMEIVSTVADVKRANNIKVLDNSREMEILENIRRNSPAELAPYAIELFTRLMELSRSYQSERLK